MSQMRLANSLGDKPGIAKPWCGRSLYSSKNWRRSKANSCSFCHDLSSSHSLRVRTNLSAMPLDSGRCRAMSTWMNSSLRINVLKALALKCVPRSEIRKSNSGGSSVRNASTIISAVTFAPATKSGKLKHCRVQLSTMTRMAIQSSTDFSLRAIAYYEPERTLIR